MTGLGLFVPSSGTTNPQWAPLDFADLYGNTWVHGATWSGELNGQYAAGPGVYPPNGTTYPPIGMIGLLTEQPAPSQSNGEYTYNPGFNAGQYTGFTPSNPNGHSQLGNLASGATSTLQGEDGVFGAYVLGDEYSAGGQSLAQMTCQYNWPLNTALFSNPDAVLTCSIDVTFPTAVNAPYMHLNIGFTGPGGTYFEFVYSILFATIGTPTSPGVSHTAGVGSENAFELILPLGDAGTTNYMTTISGAYDGSVWTGYRTLSFSISYTQFQNALQYMATRALSPNPFIGQTNPATYSAQQTHLNAEIQTATAGTIMGWSAKNWTLTLSGASATPAATPTFSPAAGNYTSAQTVTISSATAGATIYYTTDGSTPTTSSSVYSTPLTVSASQTIKAIATEAPAYTQSAIGGAAYNIEVPAATPTLSPVSGTYAGAQTVTISDATVGSTIYYTTDGTTPTTGSTVYSGPITVSASETVKAIATASGYLTSAVGSATYTITIAANYLGVNLGYLANYNTEQPLADEFSLATSNYNNFSGWSISGGTMTLPQLYGLLDANGYLTGLTGGSTVKAYINSQMAAPLAAGGLPPGANTLYRTGQRTLQITGGGGQTFVFSGDVQSGSLATSSGSIDITGGLTFTSNLTAGQIATLTFNIATATNSGYQLGINTIPASNRVTGIHIVRSAVYAGWSEGQPNPDWVTSITNGGAGGYSRLRFMDPMAMAQGSNGESQLYEYQLPALTTGSSTTQTLAGGQTWGGPNVTGYPCVLGNGNTQDTGQNNTFSATYGSGVITFGSAFTHSVSAGNNNFWAPLFNGWSNRNQPQFAFAGAGNGNGTPQTLPYETAIGMSKATNTDCDLCVPVWANSFTGLGSAFWTGLATLIKSSLTPSGLKAIIRLANEIFIETDEEYCAVCANAQFGNNTGNFDQWIGAQTALISQAFSAVGLVLGVDFLIGCDTQFTGSVGGGNGANFIKNMMAAPLAITAGMIAEAPKNYMTHWSFAPYFPGSGPTAADMTTMLNTANPLNAYFDCMYSHTDRYGNTYSSIDAAGFVGGTIAGITNLIAGATAGQTWAAIPIHCYESGPSFPANGYTNAAGSYTGPYGGGAYTTLQTAVTALFENAHRDSRMGLVHYDPTNVLSSNPGFLPAAKAAAIAAGASAFTMNYFASCGTMTVFGPWYALENIMQLPANGGSGSIATNAPCYGANMEWIAA